jgi:hypothetical protein
MRDDTVSCEAKIFRGVLKESFHDFPTACAAAKDGVDIGTHLR